MYIFYFSVVFNAGKEVRMRIHLLIHIMNKIKIKHLIYLDQENVCHVYNGMKSRNVSLLVKDNDLFPKTNMTLKISIFHHQKTQETEESLNQTCTFNFTTVGVHFHFTTISCCGLTVRNVIELNEITCN